MLYADGSLTIPQLTPSGTYTITYQICQVIEPSNCDVATVIIVISAGEYELKTQKVITPNGDDLNQFMKIIDIENYPNNTVVIFNRWGNMVWEVKGYTNLDPSKRFEGNANVRASGPLPDGTYFYVIDKGDGSAPIKNFVVIKR